MNSYGWKDLAIGMTHEFAASFTEEMAAQFGWISGDANPLHINREYAASVGYESPVLYGMLSSSLYSQLVGVYLPGKYALLQGIDIDFHAPCFAGDLLKIEGHIVFLMEAYNRIEIKATIRMADGKRVSKALIRVGMHV